MTTRRAAQAALSAAQRVQNQEQVRTYLTDNLFRSEGKLHAEPVLGQQGIATCNQQAGHSFVPISYEVVRHRSAS